MKILSIFNIFGVLLFIASNVSFAELVTNDDSGFGDCVIDFDQFGSGVISGSLEIGTSENSNTNKSIYLTSSPGGSIATYMQSAGFGGNGIWNFFDDDGAFTASSGGSNPVNRFLDYSFNDGLVSSIGGFINYCTGGSCGETDVTIAAIAIDGSVSETYNLLVDAPIVSEGGFRGIVRPSNDIAAFRVSSSGTFFALDNLAFNEVNATPIPTSRELLPLNALTTWTYLVDNSVIETETVLPGTRNVDGIETIGIQDSDGYIEYYSNDEFGLREHLGVDTNGDTITLNPSAVHFNAQPSICDVVNNTGSAQFNIIGTGVLNYPYSYTSRFVGQESISVPLGTFDAYRIETSITISGTSNGFFIDSTVTGTTWLVADIGIVKETTNDNGVISTRELLSVQNPPEILTPVEGSTLSGNSVIVTWDAMNAIPDNWAVNMGSTPLTFDVTFSGNLPSNARQVTFNNLPTNGRTLYITLYTYTNGVYTVVDTSQYTAFTGPSPAITTPVDGATLSSGSVTVNWNSNGVIPDNWQVNVGSTPGAYDITNSGRLSSNASQATLNGLPVNGQTVYIQLYTYINGRWTIVDENQYTAVTLFVGQFNVSGTQTDTGCSDPADNGTSSYTGVFSISNQTNNTFTGNLTFLTVDGIALSGTGVSATGIFNADSIQQTNSSGDYVLNGNQGATLIARNEGMFTGTLNGNMVSINYTGMDTVGDICQATGSFSGSR